MEVYGNNIDYSIWSNDNEVIAAAAEDPFYSPLPIDIIDYKHKEVGERNDEDINDETTTKATSTPTTTGEEKN